MIGLASHLVANPVVVRPATTGLFGWPSRDSTSVNPANTVMIRIADFTRAGEAVEVTASGQVQINTGRSYGTVAAGPDGVDLVRSAIRTRISLTNTVVYTPEEDGMIARGSTAVPTENMTSLMPRWGGLFGAFAPTTTVANPAFSANRASKVPAGIDPVSISWVGSHRIFIAPGPGSLFVGVNDTDPRDAAGSFTVNAVPVRAISVSLNSDQITEGANVSGTFSLLDPLTQATDFLVSVPGDAAFGTVTVHLGVGDATGTFSVPSPDNEMVERHRFMSLNVSSNSPGFLKSVAEFAYFDNDWTGLDEDGDQMSDIWQATHQIATGDTDSDPDGDGYSNFEEDKWGTNPKSASSNPGIRIAQTAPTTCVLAPTQLGYKFQIYGSENLKDFLPMSQIIEGTGQEMEVVIQTGTAKRYFFKRVAVGAKDRDGDGLSDVDELAIGTDPNLSDTDADGALDGYEASKFAYFPRAGAVAAVPRSLKAPIGPGAGGGMERFPKPSTNPLNPDDDSDGIPDGAELAFFSTEGHATHRKLGFEPYTLPATGPIPVFLAERRRWEEVDHVVAPDVTPPCLPQLQWGGGYYEKRYSLSGLFSQLTDNDNIRLGLPVNRAEGWAAEVHGKAADELSRIVFESSGAGAKVSRYECQLKAQAFSGCAYVLPNGQQAIYQPTNAFEMFGPAESIRYDEFTTEANITQTWALAEPGQVGTPNGSPGAYVRVADRERDASVGRVKYRFHRADGSSVKSAKVFVRASGGEAEFREGGSEGQIPLSEEMGEAGLIYAAGYYGTVITPKSGKIFLECGATSLTFQLEFFVSNNLGVDLSAKFGGSFSHGSVATSWNGLSKRLSVNVQNISIPLGTVGDLQISVGGVVVWKTSLLPQKRQKLLFADTPTRPKDGTNIIWHAKLEAVSQEAEGSSHYRVLDSFEYGFQISDSGIITKSESIGSGIHAQVIINDNNTYVGIVIDASYTGCTEYAIRFVQTVTTSHPLDGCTSPYNDPCHFKPGSDNLPYYETDAEHKKWAIDLP